MTTLYDWVTVGVFAGLVVLFLHRSDRLTPPVDALWQYLVAGIGCALVNWLGNGGRHGAALLVALCVGGFIASVLKPFLRKR